MSVASKSRGRGRVPSSTPPNAPGKLPLISTAQQCNVSLPCAVKKGLNKVDWKPFCCSFYTRDTMPGPGLSSVKSQTVADSVERQLFPVNKAYFDKSVMQRMRDELEEAVSDDEPPSSLNKENQQDEKENGVNEGRSGLKLSKSLEDISNFLSGLKCDTEDTKKSSSIKSNDVSRSKGSGDLVGPPDESITRQNSVQSGSSSSRRVPQKTRAFAAAMHQANQSTRSSTEDVSRKKSLENVSGSDSMDRAVASNSSNSNAQKIPVVTSAPQPLQYSLPTSVSTSQVPQMPISTGQVPISTGQVPKSTGQVPITTGQVPVSTGQVPISAPGMFSAPVMPLGSGQVVPQPSESSSDYAARVAAAQRDMAFHYQQLQHATMQAQYMQALQLRHQQESLGRRAAMAAAAAGGWNPQQQQQVPLPPPLMGQQMPPPYNPQFMYQPHSTHPHIPPNMFNMYPPR